MLVSLLVAAAVSSAPQPITRPDWLTRPNADELGRLYPSWALKRRLGGQAVISCVVNVHGLLEACKIDSESPAGWGFGAAALALAPTFSMRPAMGSDGPVPGTVRIPIIFHVAGGYAASTDRPATAMESAYGGGSRLAPAKSDVSYANHDRNLILHPIWSAAPSFADVAAAYPSAAAGIAGHVVLQCPVSSDGTLHGCSAVTEQPTGKGFARAADKLTRHFRLSAESMPAKSGDPPYVDVPFHLADPSTSDFKRHRIGAPTWRLALDPTKVAQVYPEAAAAKGITTGRGVAKCAVAVDGSLTACQEMPGEPDGLGFSHSAVVVGQAMAMNPWTDEGGPVDGSEIVLPIRFNLAPGAQSASATSSK
jgi:TonB family protein